MISKGMYLYLVAEAGVGLKEKIHALQTRTQSIFQMTEALCITAGVIPIRTLPTKYFIGVKIASLRLSEVKSGLLKMAIKSFGNLT